MASYVIRICTDNEAFQHGDIGNEVARILRKLADKVEANDAALPDSHLTDINGNSVGSAVTSRSSKKI
jgi:hypothetical protein